MTTGNVGFRRVLLLRAWCWLDSWAARDPDFLPGGYADSRVDWVRLMPFLALHASCLAVFWVGVSEVAAATAFASYAVRMFAITGFYHRYFSHRAFRTTRPWQFLFAVLGNSPCQRAVVVGLPSPRPSSALGRAGQRIRLPASASGGATSDGSRRPRTAVRGHELVCEFWLGPVSRSSAVSSTRFPHARAPTLAAVGFLEGLGCVDSAVGHQGLHTKRSSISCGASRSPRCSCTMRRSRSTRSPSVRDEAVRDDDESRNSWLSRSSPWARDGTTTTTIIRARANQGFFWWEIDITYYGLKALSWVGIIHGLKQVPPHHRDVPAAEMQPSRPAKTWNCHVERQ